jgi:transketolase
VLHWPPEPFSVPAQATSHLGECVARGAELVDRWQAARERYRESFPAELATFDEWMAGRLPADWRRALPAFKPTDSLATRQASATTLQALVGAVPNLVGGSADLAGSTGLTLKGLKRFGPGASGQAVSWGIREHGMGSALNGMAAHGGVRPYGSTFLVFADYMKPSIRLASLMRLPVIYVFSHDSIGVGEDGPTHQPIEQLSMLRAIPNLHLIRPGSPAETAEAWAAALERTDGPTALILTRQKLPGIDHGRYGGAEGTRRGGYVLFDPPDARAILIATGSELGLALHSGEALTQSGLPTRVVSLPSWELFQGEPASYRDQVLPPSIRARVSVEAAATFGWLRWVTESGESLGLDHFGASAPGDRLFQEFGFTTERVIETVKRVMERNR